MKTTSKRKICWNCGGSVSREILNCPYCSVYLNREGNEPEEIDDDEEEEEVQPPFSLTSVQENSIPQPPYAGVNAAETVLPVENVISKKPIAGWKVIVLPLLLLLAGSSFLLFSAILFLFSQNGLLTLQWKATHWPFYLLAALPLLYFGWNALQNIQEDSEESDE